MTMIGSVVTIIEAKVFAGKEKEFLALVDELQTLIKRKGYGFGQILQDVKNPRCYYDIRTWSSPEAAERCKSDTEVQTLVAKLDRTRKQARPVGLARSLKLAASGSQAAASSRWTGRGAGVGTTVAR